MQTMKASCLVAIASSLGLGQALLIQQGVLRSKPFAMRRLTLTKAKVSDGDGRGAHAEVLTKAKLFVFALPRH
jgi:hypothetical protein